MATVASRQVEALAKVATVEIGASKITGRAEADRVLQMSPQPDLVAAGGLTVRPVQLGPAAVDFTGRSPSE